MNITDCNVECPSGCVCSLDYFEVIRECEEGISMLALSYPSEMRHLQITGTIHNIRDYALLALPHDLMTLSISNINLEYLSSSEMCFRFI